MMISKKKLKNAKQVVWTVNTKSELTDILKYWVTSNNSKKFSERLNLLIERELMLISKFPEIGKSSDVKNVLVKTIQKYLLYYELIGETLFALTIRHGSRNPKTLILK